MIFLLSIIIPFSNARQVGFIYAGFLVSYWMFCYNKKTVSSYQNTILTILLIVQIIAGAFSVVKEIRHPFSNGTHVKEFIREIPAGAKWVTDYWCLNTIVAYTDANAYCIDLQQEKSFLKWNKEMKAMLQSNRRYSDGLNALFQRENLDSLFMVTIHSPQNIAGIDKFVFNDYEISPMKKMEGAIEKGSNLYLYKVLKK